MGARGRWGRRAQIPGPGASAQASQGAPGAEGGSGQGGGRRGQGSAELGHAFVRLAERRRPARRPCASRGARCAGAPDARIVNLWRGAPEDQRALAEVENTHHTARRQRDQTGPGRRDHCRRRWHRLERADAPGALRRGLSLGRGFGHRRRGACGRPGGAGRAQSGRRTGVRAGTPRLGSGAGRKPGSGKAAPSCGRCVRCSYTGVSVLGRATRARLTTPVHLTLCWAQVDRASSFERGFEGALKALGGKSRGSAGQDGSQLSRHISGQVFRPRTSAASTARCVGMRRRRGGTVSLLTTCAAALSCCSCVILHHQCNEYFN